MVDPMCLDSKLVECGPQRMFDSGVTLPASVCAKFDGDFAACKPQKVVLITIGLFTIVQIARNVQMLIPAYDFCVPEKECVTTSDNPCELFRRIDFPMCEFFPPRAGEGDCGCGCGDCH